MSEAWSCSKDDASSDQTAPLGPVPNHSDPGSGTALVTSSSEQQAEDDLADQEMLEVDLQDGTGEAHTTLPDDSEEPNQQYSPSARE